MNTTRMRELLSGGVVILGGVAFSLGAMQYQLGTFSEMGPGMFPFIVGLAIALTGALIVLGGLLGTEDDPPDISSEERSRNIRALLLVVAALTVFGLTISRFGMVPSVVALVLLVGIAERDRKPLQSLAVAVLLAVLTTLLFIYGLGMNIAVFAWGM